MMKPQATAVASGLVIAATHVIPGGLFFRENLAGSRILIIMIIKTLNLIERTIRRGSL